jgi:hypothetical protein
MCTCRLVTVSSVRRVSVPSTAQQQVPAAVCKVVIAAALIGPQNRQLVVGSERDNGLARMDAGVLIAADSSQQPQAVCGVLEVAAQRARDEGWPYE